MKNGAVEAQRWIAQSENDLKFAKVAFKENYYSQCCFVSQQSAEKAVKAVHYSRGVRLVIGHSIYQLLKKLESDSNDELIETAKVLDQFYIAARYPNGLPGGAPYEVFTKKQAQEAFEGAEKIFNWASCHIQHK